MTPDLITQQLTDLARTAWPAPRPGARLRAVAAMTGVRPHRHPPLVRALVIALLLLLTATAALAAARLLIRGRLSFEEYSDGGGTHLTWQTRVAHYLTGTVDARSAPSLYGWGDIGSRSGRIVHHNQPGESFITHIYVSDPDGSHLVDLTEPAGPYGSNCFPRWSPDETMIAFQHADVAPGRKPCDTWNAWVMNADGSNARQVSPEGGPRLNVWGWFPNSWRLLAERVSGGGGAVSIDVRDGGVRTLSNVGAYAAISPDGARIASGISRAGTDRGRGGVWLQLLLTDADGKRPHVIAQQFLSDSDLGAHVAAQRARRDRLPSYRGMSDSDLRGDITAWVGPDHPVWSPDGKEIAFLAAMPFDPKGVWYKDQIEVWAYSLRTGKPVRITHDQVMQTNVRWRR